MSEYHKIQSVFKRDMETNRFIIGEWSTPEFAYLQGLRWEWSEKIDGTNIRIHWNGEARRFGGKTDNASIPAHLIARLEDLFTPEKLREVFPLTPGEPLDVVLYGEGFGAKIQKGGAYIPNGCDFILFDVRVGRWWLERSAVEDVGAKLGLRVTEVVGSGTLGEAMEFVRGGFPSRIGTAQAEGLVLRPEVMLFSRSGQRIITKLKTRDFR